MTTIQLVIVCLTVVAVVRAAGTGILAIARVNAAARIRTPATEAAPRRIGHRVTVHTKQPDDQTIFGVVVGDYTDRLVLEDAELVTGSAVHPLPGRQDIETTDISWLDVHQLVADQTPTLTEA